MSLEYDDDETDRLLAAADDIHFAREIQPRTSPELLGAAESPTLEAAKSTAGMAHREGSDGELGRGEGLCQGPSLIISDGRFSRHIPSNRQGGYYTLEEAYYFCRCGLGSGTFSRASSHCKPSLTSMYERQEF